MIIISRHNERCQLLLDPGLILILAIQRNNWSSCIELLPWEKKNNADKWRQFLSDILHVEPIENYSSVVLNPILTKSIANYLIDLDFWMAKPIQTSSYKWTECVIRFPTNYLHVHRGTFMSHLSHLCHVIGMSYSVQAVHRVTFLSLLYHICVTYVYLSLLSCYMRHRIRDGSWLFDPN